MHYFHQMRAFGQLKYFKSLIWLFNQQLTTWEHIVKLSTLANFLRFYMVFFIHYTTSCGEDKFLLKFIYESLFLERSMNGKTFIWWQIISLWRSITSFLCLYKAVSLVRMKEVFIYQGQLVHFDLNLSMEPVCILHQKLSKVVTAWN